MTFRRAVLSGFCGVVLGGCFQGTDGVNSSGGSGGTGGRPTDAGGDAGDGGLPDGGPADSGTTFSSFGVGSGAYPCGRGEALFQSTVSDLIGALLGGQTVGLPLAGVEVWTEPATSQALTDDAGVFQLCVPVGLPFVTRLHLVDGGFWDLALAEQVLTGDQIYAPRDGLPLVSDTVVLDTDRAVLAAVLEIDPQGVCHSHNACFSVSPSVELPDGGAIDAGSVGYFEFRQATSRRTRTPSGSR